MSSSFTLNLFSRTVELISIERQSDFPIYMFCCRVTKILASMCEIVLRIGLLAPRWQFHLATTPLTISEANDLNEARYALFEDSPQACLTPTIQLHGKI